MSENGSKALSLQEILATQRKSEPRKVLFGDGHVLVRTGSMADKSAIEREGRTETGMHPHRTRRALLMRALVNEDGSLMLKSKADADKLMELDARLLDPVIAAAFDEFGFTKQDVEDIEKN